MNKLARIAVLCLVVFIVFAPVIAFAEDAVTTEIQKAEYNAAKSTAKASFGYLGIALGAGLAAIGGGIALGMLGSSVVDAAARQPEMRGQLTTIMFIVAALIEGLALFALVICILCLFL